MALRQPLDFFIIGDFANTSSKQYDLVNCSLLGSGLSGDVFLVQDQTHGLVALKRFKTNDNKSSSSSGSLSSCCLRRNIKMFKTEVNILKMCQHPNLMTLISSDRLTDSLCITMPYMNGGTLAREIRDLTLPMTVRYFFQIADAVKYLHGKKIVHLDIKPSNVLINDQNEAVLTDFGLSRVVPNYTVKFFVEQGTKGYMAPETGGSTRVDPFKVDMYALGMTLWQMTFKKCPISVKDHLKLVRQTNLTPRWKQLLECLLHDDPSMRADAAQVAEGNLS